MLLIETYAGALDRNICCGMAGHRFANYNLGSDEIAYLGVSAPNAIASLELHSKK